MKKLLRISVLFVFGMMITASMFAQDNTQPQDPQPDKDAPVIEFENVVHDYGTIPFGSDGSCEFVFKNTGKNPLVLSNVRSSCGCTVPSWTKEPVEKGKTGTIKVSYNTKIAGSFTKTVTVYSNATNSTIRLTIKGVVQQNQAN